MVRPKKEINWDVVEKLMECQSTANEIAGKFRINHDTFYRRFKEEYGESYQDYQATIQAAGLADLRAMLHAKALNNKAPGNSNLLIFLAKTLLGMKETEIEVHKAPNQSDIDKDHLIMRLQNKICQLENKDGNKSQTE
jgi:hypothetical protein